MIEDKILVWSLIFASIVVFFWKVRPFLLKWEEEEPFDLATVPFTFVFYIFATACVIGIADWFMHLFL